MAARPLLAASLAFVCGAGLGAWLPQVPGAWAWAAATLLASWAALLCAGAQRAGSAAGLAVFAVLGVLRCQSRTGAAVRGRGADRGGGGRRGRAARRGRPSRARARRSCSSRARGCAAAARPAALALPLQVVVAGACEGFEVGDLVVARGQRAAAARRPQPRLVPRAGRAPAEPLRGVAHRQLPGLGAPGRPRPRERTASRGAALARGRAPLLEARPGAPGAILDALTTGERAAIPRDVQEAFTGSGLAHVLAISGMNVAFLAALVFLDAAPRARALPSRWCCACPRSRSRRA